MTRRGRDYFIRLGQRSAKAREQRRMAWILARIEGLTKYDAFRVAYHMGYTLGNRHAKRGKTAVA